MAALSFSSVAARLAELAAAALVAVGHQQRKKLAVIAGRVDVEFELDGMDLGALLVGREDAGARAGNGDGGGEVGIVGVEDVEAARALIGIGSGARPIPRRERLRCAPATSSAARE